MAEAPHIAVGGENLIDHVTSDGQVSALPGGSPFNVAMALGRLGARVSYISPISTDHWGDRLAERLTASGVHLTGGRRPEPSTLSRVTVSGGIPTYAFEREGTAERQVTQAGLSAALPRDVQALHTGSLALAEGPDAAAWEGFSAECAGRGMVVSLDANVRLSVIADAESYRARLHRMAAAAHVFKLSDEDLSGLFPDLPADEALAQMRALAPKALFVMTRGPQGASTWWVGARIDLPAPPVANLVDTVGAGDTFMAALLQGLGDAGALSPEALRALSRERLATIIHRALMAASLNCGREGCDPPTRPQLDAALAGRA